MRLSMHSMCVPGAIVFSLNLCRVNKRDIVGNARLSARIRPIARTHNYRPTRLRENAPRVLKEEEFIEDMHRTTLIFRRSTISARQLVRYDGQSISESICQWIEQKNFPSGW